MKPFLKSLMNSDAGVTAIEYGLLGALIAVAIVVSVSSVGTGILQLYNDISDKVVAAMP